jgi:hypothetical protein
MEFRRTITCPLVRRKWAQEVELRRISIFILVLKRRGTSMNRMKSITLLIAAALLVAPMIVLSQAGGQKQTLIINGQSTQVPLIQVNGHPYVGLEALADALNGSLSSSDTMFALSFSTGSANSASSATTRASAATASAAQSQAAAANQGFSKQFLDAGIEEMSTLREWHTALASAIQNGIPLSAGLLAPYKAQAATNLRLAEVAAVTPSDHNAFQLLNNGFQNMGKLADKYINRRADLTYISPDSLKNDELDQRLIACGRSLRSMAANGQFVDDGSCD